MEGFSKMRNQLFQSLQAWFETGMPLSFSSVPLLPAATQRRLQLPTLVGIDSIETLASEEPTSTTTASPYSLVSHQNVYHPRREDTLLLRSGQTVSTSLLHKLCQFGIDIVAFCSLKEKKTGVLHPITDETRGWLPADYHQPHTQTMMTYPRRNRSSNPPTLPVPVGISLPVRTRFEETLKALNACPLPTLLVLNPELREQRKVGRLLGAIGVEHQQIHPVLMAETLAYLLRRHTPHTLIVDEAWWQTESVVDTENMESSVRVAQQFTAFITTLVEQLHRLKAHQGVGATADSLTLILMLTPQSATHQEVLAEALRLLSPVATVQVVWKPYKRQLVKEALHSFLQATELQLGRRQEEPSFARLLE